MCTWLHFPFWCSFLWGVQKEKENPMSCVFLFFCFFSCVSSFLKKSVKWTTKGKVKENDFWLNFRFLTLTHNISWSFFSTSNHSEILFASPHASSQQQKQKQKQRCWIATSSRTDVSSTRMPTCLVCESSRWWTPQPCQVGWSHWIQTTKKGSQFADHFGVGSTMLTNFFKAKLFKIVQNCSDLSHASSQETEENASSFSSRNKELGNGVQKERNGGENDFFEENATKHVQHETVVFVLTLFFEAKGTKWTLLIWLVMSALSPTVAPFFSQLKVMLHQKNTLMCIIHHSQSVKNDCLQCHGACSFEFACWKERTSMHFQLRFSNFSQFSAFLHWWGLNSQHFWMLQLQADSLSSWQEWEIQHEETKSCQMDKQTKVKITCQMTQGITSVCSHWAKQMIWWSSSFWSIALHFCRSKWFHAG